MIVMKYFLVCFLLIISCKSANTDTGNPNVVIGTAVNEKAGAILSSNGQTYFMAGLHSWDSIYLGKKVKVTGTFKFVDWEAEREKSDNPLLNTLQAQAYAKFYTVTDATWELYYAD
jgi:hypothetical protein